MTEATASALVELAARCEAAEGPERELDALIRCAAFAPAGSYVRQSPINGAWCVYETGYNGRERIWEPRGLTTLQMWGEYTASIDAAMSLVPEGAGLYLNRYWTAARSSAVWSAEIATGGVPDSPRRLFDCYDAATSALALCAAALRARAATLSQDHPHV